MSSCLGSSCPKYLQLASDCDSLGWHCLVEGRISSSWLPAIALSLPTSHRRLSPERWSHQLIKHLLNISHSQWIFRNNHIHYRHVDGLTSAKHDELFKLVDDLMGVDPSDLLPCHRYLLDKDFGALAEGPTRPRQYWVANM